MIQHSYTGQIANNIAILIEEMKAQGVTNEFAQIGMLSVFGEESGFIPRCEKSYRKTSNSRLRMLFGARLKKYTDEQLTAIKQRDIEFFDVIYGKDSNFKWSTGNTDPGDGWKYRARSYGQITFKNTYKLCSEIVGVDLVTYPDRINEPKISAKISVYFLLLSLKKHGIDPNSFTSKEIAAHEFIKANAGTTKSMMGTDTYKRVKIVEKNLTVI